MVLGNLDFVGPAFDETQPMSFALPDDLAGLLRKVNGFIAFRGALHVRGACAEPTWHSLEAICTGPRALHSLYGAVYGTDIPFAQDCVADQYILRDGAVYKLESETGVVEALGLSLSQFLEAAIADPVEFLGMQPLLRFMRDGGSLQPGQVLHVYPPFSTQESANGVSLRAVPFNDAISYLSDLASLTSKLRDGDQFQITVVE